MPNFDYDILLEPRDTEIQRKDVPSPRYTSAERVSLKRNEGSTRTGTYMPGVPDYVPREPEYSDGEEESTYMPGVPNYVPREPEYGGDEEKEPSGRPGGPAPNLSPDEEGTEEEIGETIQLEWWPTSTHLQPFMREWGGWLRDLVEGNPMQEVPFPFQFAEPGETEDGEPVDGGNGGEEGGERTHTVIRGDTMSNIAQRYGVSLSRLIESNPQIENPNRIYPGQEITIPGAPEEEVPPEGGEGEEEVPPEVEPEQPEETTPEERTERTRTVVSGDTLSEIAAQNNTTVQELMDLNPDITNPDRIYIGQEITLPGEEEVPEEEVPPEETEGEHDRGYVPPEREEQTIEEEEKTPTVEPIPGYSSTKEVLKTIKDRLGLDFGEEASSQDKWQAFVNAIPQADLQTQQLIQSLAVDPETQQWYTRDVAQLVNPKYL